MWLKSFDKRKKWTFALLKSIPPEIRARHYKKRRKTSVNKIITIILCIIIFAYWCFWRKFERTFKLAKVENKDDKSLSVTVQERKHHKIKGENSQNQISIKTNEKIVLPRCVDKWKPPSNLANSLFVKPKLGSKPLPPFTSGDPPICRLNSSTRSPIPVILVTKGRSGSSSTWQVMSRLTGHCYRCDEYPGSDEILQKQFLDTLTSNDNGNWILRNLCAQQHEYKEKGGIIGFKWKPFNTTINNTAIVDGLRMVGSHFDPPIKVIRAQRNYLDVFVSQRKHRRMKQNNTESFAHCSPGNTTCLEAHKKFGTGIYIPTYYLLNKLRTITNFENRFDQYLKEFNVPFINVSYEKLYQSNDTEEWMRIFRFLGRGPGSNLSRNLVDKAMEHVKTSSPFHNESMSNYEQIKDMLKGTEWETLLH